MIYAQQSFIKPNTLYFISSVFTQGKKNYEAKDKGHIVFDHKKGDAACFTSCNFIKLKYTMKGSDNFVFNAIIPDKELCPDPMISLEEDLKSALPKVTNFTVKENILIFFNKKDTLMIFYEKPLQHRK